MATIEARASEELRRLQDRTRNALALAMTALLVALGVALPAVWTISERLLSVELERSSFLLRSPRGDVLIQQSLASGPSHFAIYFTVLAPGGAPVTGLGPNDLEVSTDELGLIDQFELAPVSPQTDKLNLFVAIDNSPAMVLDGRLSAVRDALKPWVQWLNPYQAALISFGGQPRYEAELGLAEAQFPRALERVMPAGAPALFDAVVLASDRAEGRESRMALALVAGGEDAASKTRLPEAWARAHAATLPIFAIGVGDSVNRGALEELSRKTGGRAFFTSDATAVPGLLRSVSDLLSAQHKLTAPALLPRPGTAIARAVATCLAAGLLVALYAVVRRWLKTPQLVVVSGPKHGLSVRLSGEILICGSDPGCHLQVPGEVKTTAGRRFALERRGPIVSFHLLDPSGGTTVNRALIEARDLVSGDVIRAGLARFLFFRHETIAPASSAPVPPRDAVRIAGPFWIVSEDGGPIYKIDGERIRVGREPDNDIVLEDPSVSRRHAEFVMNDVGVELADLGSRNGTYLAESRVGSPAPLHDGMRVRFGRIKFTVSRVPPGDDPFELSELGTSEPDADPMPSPPPISVPDEPEIKAQPAFEAVPTAEAESPAPPPEPAAAEPEAKPEGPCPVCGHGNRPKARYCTQCGEKLV